MSNTITVTFYTKIFCPLCETRLAGDVSYDLAVPATAICMECGQKLTGNRRVSTANGKTKVWVEYR